MQLDALRSEGRGLGGRLLAVEVIVIQKTAVAIEVWAAKDQ
jgi:hypothetical protein